jgi:hypothetical protein
VWCGILGDSIIGPCFIDGNLNGQKYTNFLTDELPDLLENISIVRRNRMWFQHDGCPAHNASITRQILDQKFHKVGSVVVQILNGLHVRRILYL